MNKLIRNLKLVATDRHRTTPTDGRAHATAPERVGVDPYDRSRVEPITFGSVLVDGLRAM
jgi:hypothetical protein